MTVMNGAGVIIGGGQYINGWQYRNNSLSYNQELDSWEEFEALSLREGYVLKHFLFQIPERLAATTH